MKLKIHGKKYVSKIITNHLKKKFQRVIKSTLSHHVQCLNTTCTQPLTTF